MGISSVHYTSAHSYNSYVCNGNFKFSNLFYIDSKIGFILIFFNFQSDSVDCQEHENEDSSDLKNLKPCITFHKKKNLELGITKNTLKSEFLRTAGKFEQETIHERKFKRLNHIAEVMLDLTNHLQSQQVEHIEVIQEKVAHLLKILDIFNMFHTKAAINKFTMIGSIVRMKQNIGNIVRNIILNNAFKSNYDFIQILSKKLKVFVLNFKTQVKNRSRINKRSIIHTHELIEELKSLNVNKLNLINEQKSNMKLNFLSVHSKEIIHLISKINLHRLIVGILENNNIAEGSRGKRATSLPFLDHSKIVSKTLNNIALENLMNGLFKNGKNTFINGLFKLCKFFISS